MISIDSFSGRAADLPQGSQTADDVLSVLRKSPRVSCWDMEELPWLREAVAALTLRGLIKFDAKEQYPWIRYIVEDRADG